MSGRTAAVHPASEQDPDVWRYVTVDESDERVDEPLGTKEKFWVRRTQDSRLWLFKYVRTQNSRVLGEDWAEWVVHKIAQLLGVPSATILPATADGKRGILSRAVVNTQIGEDLVLGNELLAQADTEYDPALDGHNPRYTLDLIQNVLETVTSSPEYLPQPNLSGFDLFAGYLVLDALVAGQDRHHENWAIIRVADHRYLSPSFDHGNALGFAVPIQQAERLTREPELLASWLARGKSRHFASRPSLIFLAHDALRRASPASRTYWRRKLEAFNPLQMETMLASVPTDVMSDDARTLAVSIVLENRRRLLNDYPKY